MANKTILLKRSSVVTDNGRPKEPLATILQPGEVAVNYANGVETIFIKNTNGEVVGTYINGTFQTAIEALLNHVNDNANPHNVTKAQLGLGNVSDTADADLPVSLPQRLALNKLVKKEDIVNNCDSSSATKVLAASQGFALAQMVSQATGGNSTVLQSIESRLTTLEDLCNDALGRCDAIIQMEQEWQEDNTAHDNFI